VEYPVEVDYFILDPKTPDPVWNERLKKEFADLYGSKPKAIKIMFPPVSPELFFAQWFKRYGKSTLVKCKGDNEIATTTEEFAEGLEKVGEDDRGFIQVKCLGPECSYQKNNQCSRMASLQVILPELKGMGIWQINTGSFNSIVNINSALDWLKGLCGRYAMLPVTLMRVETDIPYEGKRSKHYILQVDQQTFSIGDIQQFAAVNTVERALIPAPDESKDTLFYDKNGKKPEIEVEEVEFHEEPASDGDILGEKGVGAPEEEGKPLSPTESEKLREDLFKDFKAIKASKTEIETGILLVDKVKRAWRQVKNDKSFLSMHETDQKQLKADVEAYLMAKQRGVK